jgi:hypothetical protein
MLCDDVTESWMSGPECAPQGSVTGLLQGESGEALSRVKRGAESVFQLGASNVRHAQVVDATRSSQTRLGLILV